MPGEMGPSDTQFWMNIYSTEISSNECLSKVRLLLNCPSKITAARSLRGNEAQMFIDFLDQVLARSHLDDKLRNRSLRLLSKICKAHRIIPASYVVHQELIRVGKVHYYGGSADVSKGEYSRSPVAIKRLKVNDGDLDRVFRRLFRETIGWKHLTHPNLLPLLGISVSEDSCCFRILTEWMPNGNVMQYARSNPEVNRLGLLSEVMAGVAYLHGVRVVHGDLKGTNILVDNNGTARVADFGLMTGVTDFSTFFLSETRFGSNGRPTRESDRYAVGMVIYEVLTGLRPFHHLCSYAPVAVVLRGERPEKPRNAESLGFSSILWGLVQLCWSELGSARPTAQRLFDYLSLASLTWAPSPGYPIHGVEAPSTTESYSSGSSRESLESSTDWVWER